MRAAFLLYGTLDQLSGGFLYDRRVVRYLEARGDEVRVISLGSPCYGRGLLDNLGRGVARRLADAGFDVILEDELAHPSLWGVNMRLKKAHAAPVVSIVHHLRCSEHHPPWRNSIYRRVEKAYLASVDAFVFNSGTTRESVRSLLGRDVRSVVAYPSVGHSSAMTDNEIILRARQRRVLEVLFIGNVIRRKNLHVLVEAMGYVTGNRHLTVVGSLAADPAYVKEVEALIGTRGLAPKITFLGRVPDADVARLLKGGHVLVMPSAYEGFGIAYLEAMACGLPAIGTTAGGAREIVTDGCDGFLVLVGDAWALAKRIQLLADNRDMLAEMGCSALATYQSRPTWDDCGSTVYDFLHGLTH